MENKFKLVEFDKFCSKCKYKNEVEDHPKCRECLQIPAREYSHTPEYFEEK